MKSRIIQNNKLISNIKNIIISFFALIFILGFFSRTFINIILPEVQTVPAINNTSIKKTIEVEGNMRPRTVYKVRIDRDIIVEEYFIKTGDLVKLGTPLFRINQSYSGKENNETIDELNLQLQEQQVELKRLQTMTTANWEKAISIIKDKINNAHKELEDNEILYQSGAISKSNYEKSKLQLEELIISLETDVIQHEDEIRNHQYLIDKTQNNIDKINTRIADLKSHEKFYASLGEDGIYYAENKGIILTTEDANTILTKDTSILEIAIVEGFDSVKFMAQINQDQYDILKEIGTIEVTNKDMSKDKIIVTNISRLANGSMLELEGKFIDELNRDIILDEKIRGVAAKTYETGNNYCIPKTAIIPARELKEGSNGNVYIIEENHGALGKETVAKEVKVEIIAVGDDKVIVQGLDNYKKPQVINNLSYKVRDGVRVRVWE